MPELPGARLGSKLRHFKRERVEKLPAQIVRETVRSFGESLVTDWTPYGQPEFWKAPPPADYRPGNLQSSWFFSVGSPSTETTKATEHREVWHFGDLADVKAGPRLYLSNSAPHAGAIENAHSWQAETGILVNAMEFEHLAYTAARKVAP